MGECDRFKPFISDYLENNLDPSTLQQFEKALETSGELQSLTRRVRQLKLHLNNLDRVSCSADFSMRLRERIHTVPQPLFRRPGFMRLSLAFSLVVVLAVALISLMNMSDSPDPSLPYKGNTNFKIEEVNPVSNPSSPNNPALFKNDSQLDVKTRSNPGTAVDSTKINTFQNRAADEHHIERVDQKE